MKSSSLSLALAAALSVAAAVPSLAADTAASAAAKPQLGTFGVDLDARDLSAKPGNDFNRYVNGHWIETYQLKDYEVSYGSFNALRDQSEAQVKAIIEELQQ